MKGGEAQIHDVTANKLVVFFVRLFEVPDHACLHTHTHTWTVTHIVSHTHTVSHIVSLSVSLTHTHTRTVTYTHTHTQSHTPHIVTYSHTYTESYTHLKFQYLLNVQVLQNQVLAAGRRLHFYNRQFLLRTPQNHTITRILLQPGDSVEEIACLPYPVSLWKQGLPTELQSCPDNFALNYPTVLLRVNVQQVTGWLF